MTKNVDILRENSSLADVLRIAGETSQATLPVIDSEGKLAGLVVTRDLLGMLACGTRARPAGQCLRPLPLESPVDHARFESGSGSQLMEYEALDELPVTDRPRRRHFWG